MIVKPKLLFLFDGIGFQVTVQGKHYLRTTLGSCLFVEQYVFEKVGLWSHCDAKLSDIAKDHPHAAYTAFTCGLYNN